MIYDIIILAIFILFIIIGVKKGAARTLASLLMSFLAYTGATFVGKWLSVTIFQNILKPTIYDTVVTNVSDFSNTTMNNAVSNLDLNSYDVLGLGLDESVKSWVSNQMSDPIESVSTNAGETAETVLEPIVTGILSFFITIFLFFLFYILLRKFVMPLILKVFKIPVIKQINAVLGGVIGAMEALLLVCMIAYLLKLIVPQISTDFYLLQESTINSSVVFSKLYAGNIFSLFASWLTI